MADANENWKQIQQSLAKAIEPVTAQIEEASQAAIVASGLAAMFTVASRRINEQVAGIFLNSAVLAQMQELSRGVTEAMSELMLQPGMLERLRAADLSLRPDSAAVIARLADEAATVDPDDESLSQIDKIRYGVALLVVTIAGALTASHATLPGEDQLRAHLLTALATLAILLQLYPLTDDQ